MNARTSRVFMRVSDTTDHDRYKRVSSFGQESPSKKVKIVERYSVGGFAESSAFRRQRDLTAQIEKNRQKLSHLILEISNSQTKKSAQEVENWKLEDELGELKKELNRSKANIAHLHVYEEDSLQTLTEVRDLKRKEIEVAHQEKLVKMKDSVSSQVLKAISEAKLKVLEEKKLLEAEVAELSSKIASHSTEMNRNLIKLKEDHHKRLLLLRESMEAMESELLVDTEALKEDIKSKQAESERLKKHLAEDIMPLESHLQKQLDSLNKEHAHKKRELEEYQESVVLARTETESIKNSFSGKLDQVAYYDDTAQALKCEFPLMEEQRRKLFNRLQELKGNIRVFCRIRPSLASDEPLIKFATPALGDINHNGKQDLTLESRQPSPAHTSGALRSTLHEFQFDKIFGPESDNKVIFQEISQLVQSSLDGYNVCVFAYGQTGSGKTWTMSHKDDGVIPLSVAKIFDLTADLRAQGWRFTLEGQFVEIYNEQIIDLLGSPQTTSKFEIKHDDVAMTTSIANCTTVSLESPEKAMKILETATNRRATAATMSNDRSSRSHCVFMLKLCGENFKSGEVRNGCLNLIDLAGSERLTASQAKGERLKETQAINKSLSCLGDVIHGLAQRQTTGLSNHIPYRNSKLTFLLKHSLGGDSKTLMFVNVSPYVKNHNETISSLRFATKVNGTKLK